MHFFSRLVQTVFRASSLALFRLVTALVCLLASLAFSTAANAQTFINFSGTPALVSGTALQQGAVYRYTAVLPGIDAVVTLAQFASTTVAMLNLDDNATLPQRFQPVITCAGTAATNANTLCYIKFDFAFFQTATNIPANIYGLVVSGQDIDGNGVANGVREFVEFTGTSSVQLGSVTTTLISAAPLAGGVRYIQANSTDVQLGIGTDAKYEMYGRYTTAPITGLSILGGNDIGSAGCAATDGACQRQNSYSFTPFDASMPSITVNKVSTGGTGTFTFTGTNGWVTQPVATVAAGVAKASQSEALLVPGVATTITESAPFGYSLTSIVCAGLGAGGTATPTVNGTAGGSVLLSAAAVAGTSNVVCTFTNRKLTATLTISKTNAVTALVAGQTTTYTIVASNTAGDNAAGAVVSDPAVAGLNCTAVTCTGAACPAPASVTVAALQSPGITLGSFPSGASVTFALTCGVTATGQ